jgi:Lrp/AsnC family transcriptional regulator, regulator for asnA, asnC and gidA
VSGKPNPAATIKLDELDKQIIEHLRLDVRQSYAKMARALGVSLATVRNRIDRLIESQAIYLDVRIDPPAIGFPIDAIVGLQVDKHHLLEVGDWLADREYVAYVAYLTGLYDIMIEVHVRDNADLFRFLTEDLMSVEGVRQTEIWTVLRTGKANYSWKGESIAESSSARPGDKA